MIEFMKKTREIYHKERKKLSFHISSYNRLTKPNWMITTKDNRFEATYRDQRVLMNKGRIAIGKIVQANTLLFRPGPDNCPAAMVFSEDTYFEENPDKLADIASKLFNIKGINTDDTELQKFADILADEMVTLFNITLPESIAFGKKVFFTTFMVQREHLPKGYIDFGCFPALICPEKTEASIILPSKYWAGDVESKVKKNKILKNKDLMNLLSTDPEKYIEVVDDHIEHAMLKSRTSWINKGKWSGRITTYRYNKSTALIYCGRFAQANAMLNELLSGIDTTKAQNSGNRYYIIILSNLASTFIELGNFEEAENAIALAEKTISNCLGDKAKIQPLYKTLNMKRIELDLLNGDLERAGRNLKELLTQPDNNKTTLGNLFIYSGIFHYKRNEKDKAIEYFNKASEIIHTPHSVKKIQYYKNMLMNDKNEDSTIVF